MTPRLAFATYLRDWVKVRRWQRDDLPTRDPLAVLSDFVEGLRDDDERLLELGTLTVRHGVFWPGPAVEEVLLGYAGGVSRGELTALLQRVRQLALADALDRARGAGVLP